MTYFSVQFITSLGIKVIRVIRMYDYVTNKFEIFYLLQKKTGTRY